MRLLVVLCVFIRALTLISNAADRADTAWSQLEGLNAKANAPVLSPQREKQLTTLVEAAMLGFELARKNTRSR